MELGDGLNEYLILHDMTDEEALKSLKRVVFYRHEGNWRLKDAISRQQREILTAPKLESGGNSKPQADKT